LDRLLNYLFWILIIFLFVIEGKANDHVLILGGLGLSLFIAYTAFFCNWITLDGTKAAIVLGTITFGFGGLWLSAALLLFFISGSLVTIRNERLDDTKRRETCNSSRRDGFQVWANGFWVAIFALCWFLFAAPAWLMAAYAVIATATADTWSTELGSRKKSHTRLITTFKPVEPGTDGGISLKGTAASIAGSALIASVLYLEAQLFSPALVLVVFGAGVAGALADSLLGALIQTRPVLDSGSELKEIPSDTATNCLVNWIATGIGGFIALLTIQILSLAI
jgi:uncharacterized protein (TIGR00297 family)